MLRKSLLLLGLWALLTVPTCKLQQVHLKHQYRQLNELVHAEARKDSLPFIKCHLQNGGVVVFQGKWQLDTAAAEIRGKGSYFQFNRQLVKEGRLTVGMDSVVLYEANRLAPAIDSRRMTALLVLSFINLQGTVQCLLNPKACYGSCPTFYTARHSSVHQAAAEGFSSAILPSLEYADVDDLDTVVAGGEFSLYMKNEALETHVVRQATLLAVPRPEGHQVYQDTGAAFYTGSRALPPHEARKASGATVLPQVQAVDDQAYFSRADSHDLATPEELYFTFAPSAGDSLGLVLDYRQSLMTTYFIYSALSYMGIAVTDYLSQKERELQAKPAQRLKIMKLLGGIEAYVYHPQEGKWQFLGEYYETGPIAINRELLPFANPARKAPLRIKLRFNQGLWRINRVGLADRQKRVEPRRLSPQALYHRGKAQPAALRRLVSPEGQLLSWPGQTRALRYQLPGKDTRYALFLRSKGYYLEWMRERWLAEQELLSLRQMMKNPAAYLRSQAAPYKVYEQTMEAVFWSSQIKPQALSQYEKP